VVASLPSPTKNLVAGPDLGTGSKKLPHLPNFFREMGPRLGTVGFFSPGI